LIVGEDEEKFVVCVVEIMKTNEQH